MTLFSAALSAIGLHRPENEDRYVQDDKSGIYGIADGIGGLPGGGEAASKAVEVVQRVLSEVPAAKRPAVIYDAVLEANREVLEVGRKISPSKGVGTTLTFGCVAGNLLCLAHLGDSRCYLLRNREIQVLTQDHTVENEIKARHARGEEDIPYMGSKAALTRCVGQVENFTPDLLSVEMKEGDQFLFCSDGVYRELSPKDLIQALGSREAVSTCVARIIQLALDGGGHDNATAVLLRVGA